MKKYLYLLLLPFLVLWGCKKPEPEPEPVKGQITVKTTGNVVLSDEGDSKQVAFSATLEWSASSSESWLTVEPRSGGKGDATITVSATANADYSPRSARVTLICGEDSKTIEVIQKQKGALLLTESAIPVSAQGGKVTITAKANSNVTAAIAQDAQGWITDITPKGLIDYIFEYAVSANPDENPRSGQIVFSNEAGSETVTIEQEAMEPEAANVTGRVLCQGAGVPDVLISDGVNIVKTDADGNYRLQSEKRWKYVFMTIPSGYEAPLDGILPAFWKPLQADVDTPEEVDFELRPVSNDNYTLLVLGDMHLARRTNDLAQFDKVAGFINKSIAEAPGKVYCLTLGDMTWDMYWVANNFGFAEYLQTMNGYFHDVPFFHTMGNHDNEMEKAGDWEKAFKYTENLSPDYYSFNLGKIHYIVMDNMDFTGVEPGEENRSKYKKNFTAEQLEWLRKDLSYVDKSTPIFVTAHEPLARPSGLNWNEQLNGADADLDTFIGIFDGYNVRYLSGHTHNLFNKNWTDTFTEHNSGAICASWWWSGYHTPGIHIAQDGAPGGYTVWTVNGTQTTHYYQAALQSRDYQFRAYDMNKVKEVISEDRSSAEGYPKYYNHIQSYGENVILVNVWDYDDDWSVEISENGTPLEVAEVGVYDPLHIEAMTIPRFNKNSGTTTFSTAKWRHFFQATASAPDTPVTVKVTDRYGNVFTEEMIRPKAFTVNDYKNQVERTRPEAEFISGSSSTLAFGWTTGGTTAEDADVPYKLELFKDAACTNLLVSYDIEAGHSCWSSKPLRFVFGGLEPSTKYWFKVTNTENGDVSDPVEGQTEAFTVVDATTVSNAGVGDIILAEDFSEISWGPDELSGAAGFIPSPKILSAPSGVNPSGVFTAYDNTGQRIFGTGIDLGSSRLSKGWGFFGNSSTYLRNAYLRLGASGGRTHMVTPPLSGIPAGKMATIEVTVTATKYDSGMQIAAFAEKGLTINSTTDASSSSYKKYTGASLSSGEVFDISTVKDFDTNTVTLSDVDSSCQILIGSVEDNGGKNRFYLSDVKVQIVSLEEVPDIQASFGIASSSSLSFTWTEGISVEDDVSKPYTIALYKDEACSQLVVSHNIPADHSCWYDNSNPEKPRQPRFVFGGLEQDTNYWFKVTDTTEGAVKSSNAVKATTLPFTRVDASTVRNAGVGDIILGEDFSE
ncbi:MAG: calcineurin-like phosphoesterase C-terminal domain-containing protein, partial [Bacteroidales bacterium]|nr:calcineurin-like phosphoesterase C-terminal domain-containing protein [Bacteroidales bacterium]